MCHGGMDDRMREDGICIGCVGGYVMRRDGVWVFRMGGHVVQIGRVYSNSKSNGRMGHLVVDGVTLKLLLEISLVAVSVS